MTKNASIARISGLEERIAEFAANCIHICDLLPRGRAGASNFKDQLARSATSVAANYAESTIPSSHRDFIGRLTIALKELAESRMHLCVISRLRYRKNLSKELMTALVNEADAIATILKTGFIVKRVTKAKSSGDGIAATPAKKRRRTKNMMVIARLLAEAEVEPRKLPGRKKGTAKPSRKSPPKKATAKTTKKTKASPAQKPKLKVVRKTKRKTSRKPPPARKPSAPSTPAKIPATLRDRILHPSLPPPSPHRLLTFSPPPLLPYAQ